MEVLEYYDDEKIRKEARFLIDSGNKNLSGISLVNRIDELAKKEGITRKDLSERLGMNPSTISSWKSKNNIPPIETLCIIADYFDISLDYLVRGYDFYNKKNKNKHNIRNEILSEIEVFKKRIELYFI